MELMRSHESRVHTIGIDAMESNETNRKETKKKINDWAAFVGWEKRKKTTVYEMSSIQFIIYVYVCTWYACAIAEQNLAAGIRRKQCRVREHETGPVAWAQCHCQAS